MKAMTLLRFCMVMFLTISANLSFAQKPRERWSAVPGDSLAIISLDLDAIRKHPELELLPWEIISVTTQEQMGVDVLSASAVEIAVGIPMPMPEFGAAVYSRNPVDISDFEIPGLGEVEESPKKPNLRFRQFETGGPVIRLAQADPTTVFVGTPTTLNRMIGGSASSTSKALEVAKESKDPIVVAFALERIRPIIMGFLNGDAGQQMPPDILKPLISIVENTKVIRLTSSIGMTSQLKLDIYGESAEAMKKVETSIEQIREAAIAMVDQQISNAMEEGADISPAMRTAIDSYSTRLKEAVRKSHWTIDNDRMHVEVQATNSTATIGILTGLLLPAVQSAREAARRMSSSNNLKQMALAMHNHADVYKKLPARAIYAKDGTPLLSWRVAILPFIEQQQLYEQFHLDEPWDSEHNEKLISKMPPLYVNPRSPGEPYHSNYVMPYGEGLPGSLEKIGFANITDGTSNTIALVEVSGEYAVPWTAPEDFDADEDSITIAFPTNGGAGANVALYDGSVRFLSQFIDEDVLHALLTHAGGEVTQGF